MLTSNEIQGYIQKYGDSLFPIPLTEYFSQTKRVMWGLQINRDEGRNDPYFGEIAPSDMEQFNKIFYDSMAGYRTKARDHFPSLTADADVFLISKQCLSLPTHEVEALIIHELCHWYIDSGLQMSSPIAIGQMDRHMGKGLYNKTDRGRIRQHTLEFCELLCAVAGRAIQCGAKFSSRKELVAFAMRFDVDGGFRV